jgi:drug/metabolite transporter (DMT)-like permease
MTGGAGGSCRDSVIGFALYNWLLRVVPVALVGTYAMPCPVVAYLLGVFVLGEAGR